MDRHVSIWCSAGQTARASRRVGRLCSAKANAKIGCGAARISSRRCATRASGSLRAGRWSPEKPPRRPRRESFIAKTSMELEEEFQVKLPEDSAQCKFHLLSIKQTRPIRNVSNIMYNFVAAAEENAWLESLDAARINAALAARRERHRAEVKDGSFWQLSQALRERVSPEIREVQWLDMRSAILHTFTSMNDSCVPVNAFQEEEFARLGIRRRDPMFLTMATLLEVESFPSVQSLALYSGGICPESELKRIQWLTDGMSPEDVRRAWERNISPTDQGRKGMFRTAEERLALRRSREHEDTRAPGASRL
mmetsp:Transcript_41521/g.134041  ORF Transcript_41521/g.134041 Transcript_41521/m.134041 type:complete len:309 (-) Transcript_41521:79-1005(-)